MQELSPLLKLFAPALLVLGLLAPAPAAVAASCAATMSACVDGPNTRAEVAPTGIKADGVTSDDVALKAAIDKCASGGGRLVLPAGRILLTGVAGPITVQNCFIEGTGVLAGKSASVPSQGTMFLLTSTTVKPFLIGSDWGMKGLSFYWPNQLDGVTVYPPLMSPLTVNTTPTSNWYIEDSTIINAYDGILASGGSFRVHDCWIYAVNDAFRISGIGDSFYVSHVHFTPGPWYQMNAGAVALRPTVTKTNTIFHFASNGLTGGVNNAINFSVDNIGAFAWRYGVKVDAPMQVGLSNFEGIFDGVGTILDTATGGGSWANANRAIKGLANCTWVGRPAGDPTPARVCFNLGANDGVTITEFSAASEGDFIDSNGSSVAVRDSFAGIGGLADGKDYYVIHTKANPGGTNIHVLNSTFAGTSNSVADPTGITHSHGIKSDVLLPRVTLQNNGFIYFRDAIDYIPGPSSIITGNWIDFTDAASTESIVSASLAASNFATLYLSNKVDKPPTAVATLCGTGCTVAGSFAGKITVGSTIPTSSGTLTLPWIQGIAVCYFWGNGLTTPISATLQAGSQRQWNWQTQGAVDIHGQSIFYACPAQN